MLFAAVLLGSQLIHYPSLKRCELRDTLKIRADGVPWTVSCYRCEDADVEHYEAEGFAIIRKRGIEVGRCAPLEIPYCSAYPVDIHPGYPVFAVRGQWGLGSHWDTILFAIRHGRLIEMGRPPAMNSNGPVLWHGNRRIWAFDNLDVYEERDNKQFRLARVLMKVGSDGRLKKWRTVATEHPHVPNTIHTPDDLATPKDGW